MKIKKQCLDCGYKWQSSKKSKTRCPECNSNKTQIGYYFEPINLDFENKKFKSIKWLLKIFFLIFIPTFVINSILINPILTAFFISVFFLSLMYFVFKFV
jgi:hypothetical protein